MFQEDIFLLLISKERFLLVFFVFLSMGKAYDAWNCSHCPVTMWEQPQITKMLTQSLDIAEQLNQSWKCLSLGFLLGKKDELV